ncbi:MAG TPA: hypothetical protein VFM63_09760 [Pyrinomonadaceae bacterium]|nr:hypothetical protein [Pyrinomonadaceae bacterium]
MRIVKGFAAVLFLLLAFDVAVACSCAEPRSPCNYYGGTAAIFVGRAVGAAEQRSVVDENGNKTTYDVGTIRFLVLENFKGASGYEVEINSGTGGGDCGYWFQRNETYLVYAFLLPDGKSFYTHICTRTRPLSAAKEDLEYLRSLSGAKPGATLYGSLKRYIGDLDRGPLEEGPKMAGVKVVVTGEGKTIETTTNNAGEFRVTGLSPGDYDASPQLPDNLIAISNRDEKDNFGRFTRREPVGLTEFGCGEINFSVQFNGVISGRIVDAAGEPAKEVQLRLGFADDEGNEQWTWTDKEGNYEFVRVQPGNYLLGFNLTWAPDKNDPYPRTFYPGVKTRAEAALITVGEGERLKGYNMTLPPRLSQREVKVTVVWPDGRPAAGVMVYYEMNDVTDPGDKVDTDTKGRATVTLFDNYHYIIYATVERNGKDVHATPIEVYVDKSLKPLRFVLSKKGYGLDEREALKRKSSN